MSLESFLNKYRVKKNERSNFLGMDTFRGSYFIPDNMKVAFYQKYHQHVFVQKKHADIIERHGDYCCLIYDLDFKLPKESDVRGYTQETIREFIDKVSSISCKYLDLDNSAFQAFVCEKEHPTIKKDCRKDGIHIYFPFIVATPEIHHLIREELLIETKHLFEEEVINSIEDIIDVAVLEKNGLMTYGSSKPDGKPYLLTKIYEYKKEDEIGVSQPTSLKKSEYLNDSKKLIDLFSIQRFTIADVASFNPEMEDFITEWITDFKRSNEKTDPSKIVSTNNNTVNLKTVYKLVEILNTERARTFEKWIQLGFCLHNIHESLLEKWIEFSERDDAYVLTARDDCTKRWTTMRNTGLNIGTLIMWAQEDNYKAYKEIIQSDIEYCIVKSIQPIVFERLKNNNPKFCLPISDIIYTIVQVLYQQFSHYFVCSNYDRREWYQFNDKGWIVGDGDIGMKTKIRNNLHGDYERIHLKYKKLAETNIQNKDKYDIIRSEVFKISQKLRDASFRRRIMDEAVEQFYWSNSDNGLSRIFEENLDVRPQLIGMKNGVYDLENGQFREMRCEDYISLNTGNEYKEYSWTDPIIEEVLNFTREVIPSKDLRDYVLLLLSSCLSGQITTEHFHIFLGSGANGKSALVDLFELSFGEYCSKLSIAALTQKRASSSAPTPEIARLRGKRFVVMQEPGEKEVLQVGLMKEMTGGDKIVARALNKEPIEFKPQFKMLLTCNELPKVPSDDDGTWRRLRVINFTSRFCENPDPEKDNEFHMDPNLSKKFERWHEPFFWILTEYYKRFKKDGYTMPPEVIAATKEYRADQDKLHDFTVSYIRRDSNGHMTLDAIIACLKIYGRAAPAIDTNLSRRRLQKYIEGKFKIKMVSQQDFYGISEINKTEESMKRCMIQDESSKNPENII